MTVQSPSNGFNESFLKTNVFQEIQRKSIDIPRPENVDIQIINEFQYTSKILNLLFRFSTNIFYRFVWIDFKSF